MKRLSFQLLLLSFLLVSLPTFAAKEWLWRTNLSNLDSGVADNERAGGVATDAQRPCV